MADSSRVNGAVCVKTRQPGEAFLGRPGQSAFRHLGGAARAARSRPATGEDPSRLIDSAIDHTASAAKFRDGAA